LQSRAKRKIVFKKFPTLLKKKNKKRNAQPPLNDTPTPHRQWFESTEEKYHWL
jgi:hypothetical protein